MRLRPEDLHRAHGFRFVLTLGPFLIASAASTATASAEGVRWANYSIPETGTSVDIPYSLFSKKAGRSEGFGERLTTPDGRADLTIQSVPNSANDSPASFLAKRNPPSHIPYRRITSQFFAVSGYKNDKVWYDRCNFSRSFVHCVLINYPASEERNWDDIVTRISLSLRAGEPG